MRSEEEVQAAFERAKEHEKSNPAYEEIKYVLGWVLEEYDDDPSE